MLVDNAALPPEPKAQLEVPPELKELIDDVDTETGNRGRSKTITLQEVITGGGVLNAGKEVLKTAEESKTLFDGFISAGPAVILAICLIGFYFYIRSSRGRKSRLGQIVRPWLPE